MIKKDEKLNFKEKFIYNLMSIRYNINTDNIPWTEKYRPNKLNNIVSQKNIINCLKKNNR